MTGFSSTTFSALKNATGIAVAYAIGSGGHQGAVEKTVIEHKLNQG